MRPRRRGTTPSALIWLALTRLSFAAVSAEDLLAQLGGSANGQTLTTAAYALTMLANDEEVLVSMSVEGSMKDTGWIGWGLGTAMAGSDIVIFWPNTDSSWTLSHRNAPSTVMPLPVDESPSSDPSMDASGSLKIVASLSSSSADDSPTVVTFSRPLVMPSGYKTDAETSELKRALNQPVIFAVGATNPGDSDPSQEVEQHNLSSMGGTFVDLSMTFDPAAAAVEAPLYPLEESAGGGGGGEETTTQKDEETSAEETATKTRTGTAAGGEATGTPTVEEEEGPTTFAGTVGATLTSKSSLASATGTKLSSSSPSSSAGSTTASSTTTQYSNLILYHAYLASFAWGLCAPLGVLIARLGRSCGFFTWHWGVQVGLTTTATVGAVGLAYWARTAKTNTSTAVRDTHVYLGFGILALLLVQCALGAFAHMGFMARSKEERAQGREIKSWAHIVLGIALIVAGFTQIKLGMTKYGVTSQNVVYGYWGIIGLFSTLYILSAVVAIANPSPPARSSRRGHHHHHSSHSHHHPHKKHHEHHEHTPAKRHHSSRRSASKTPRRKGRRRKDEEKDLLSSSGSGSGSAADSETDSGSESESGSDHRRRRKK